MAFHGGKSFDEIVGGSGIDAEAREKLSAIYKVSGDSIKPGSEVFVTLADGTVVNYANKTKKVIVVPNNPTDASLRAAGLTGIGGSVTNQEVINAVQTTKTLWTVDDMVDFTVSEPASIPANHGKLYISTKTGAGSVSTQLTFDIDDIYVMQDDGTWQEFKPQPGWIFTHQDHEYQYYGGKWNLKVAGEQYVQVSNNDHLLSGVISTAEPPLDTVYKFTQPAVGKGLSYGIANTGQGTMDVDGTQLKGPGTITWKANQLGTEWVLFSFTGSARVPTHSHSSLSDGTTTFAIRNGSLVKQTGV